MMRTFLALVDEVCQSSIDYQMQNKHTGSYHCCAGDDVVSDGVECHYDVTGTRLRKSEKTISKYNPGRSDTMCIILTSAGFSVASGHHSFQVNRQPLYPPRNHDDDVDDDDDDDGMLSVTCMAPQTA